MADVLLGLNIGGTTCSVSVGTREGELLARDSWPSMSPRGPDAMISDLIDHGRAFVGAGDHLLSVGVAVGGPMDGLHGVVLGPPNLPGWDAVPLAAQLADAFGRPVRVEHDAAACALAEALWGRFRESRRLAYFTCGTGFGVGVVSEGLPLYGANGMPPEIGHVRCRMDGPFAFGKNGSFEALGSMPGLARIAAWRFPGRWGKKIPSTRELAALIRDGDEDALVVRAFHARAVAAAAAIVIDLLGTDTLLLGSASRYLGEEWVSQVRERVREEVGFWTDCRIAPASLGEDLQDLSALASALRALSAPQA